MPDRVFLATDIVDSSTKWSRHPEAMAGDLAQHDREVRALIAGAGGSVFKHTGDGVLAVFTQLESALGATEALHGWAETAGWSVPGGHRLRIAVVEGPAEEREGDFFGGTINLLARLCASAAPGHTLFIATPPEAMTVHHVGLREFRGVDGRRRVYALQRGNSIPEQTVSTEVLRVPPLPDPSTRFVGREDVLERLHSALASSAIVTLVGPGGIGKSRLALELGARIAPSTLDGVAWVPLAEAADPVSVIWNVLTGAPVPTNPVMAVARLIELSQVVVILDGADPHLEALAPALERWHGSGARFLLTSREALNIPGEVVIRVEPLGDEALELFLDRARAGADYHPEPHEERLLRGVVSHLDGIPLALEIAASRLRSLALPDLASMLDDSLGVLQAPRRGGDPRHRTLEATFDWSFTMLEPVEREVFAVASGLRAAFRLETLRSLCGSRYGSGTLSSALAVLVDRSLVTMDAHSPTPYRLLDTLRAYGSLKRTELGLDEWFDQRRGEWAIARCRDARERLRSSDAVAATQEIGEVAQDLLAAAHQETGSRAAEIIRVLWRAWYRQGRVREALTTLEPLWKALPIHESDPAVLDARRAYGWALYLTGRINEAVSVAESCLALAERARLPDDEAQARNLLAGALLGVGNTEGAIRQYAAALSRASGDDLGQARILVNLATAKLQQGAYDRSLQDLDVAERVFSEVGDRYAEAWVMVTRGTALLCLGRTDEARALFAASRAIRESLGDRRGVAYASFGLADAAITERSLADAEDEWARGVELALAIDDPWAIDFALLVRARLAYAREDWAELSQLLPAFESRPSQASFGRTNADLEFLSQARSKVAPKPGLVDAHELLRRLVYTEAPVGRPGG